ncbi:hypothetical protein ACR6C2_38610 [Streptomyces sp. INA 01156]
MSVEAVVHDGVVGFTNITAKSVLDSRYPVETGHAVPAPLDAATADALRDALTGLAAAVGFGSGVLHSEWILVGDDRRPHLVECARLPGGGITVLIDLAHDTDILRDLLCVLEGRGPVGPLPVRRGAAVRFLTAEPGRVESVTGAEEARAAEGVHELHLTVSPGAVVRATTSSWERAGFAVATGRTCPRPSAGPSTRCPSSPSAPTLRGSSEIHQLAGLRPGDACLPHLRGHLPGQRHRHGPLSWPRPRCSSSARWA